MKVQEFLNQKRVPFAVITHEPTFDAQHMAHAVHAKGRIVAKTVLLRANHGYRYLTAILPAPGKIDLEVASRSLGGCELRLASESEVTEVCPDCEAGVLLPFGSQYGAKTVVDSSLGKQTEIVFEGNSHDESIRMTFADFCRLESPLVVPLTSQQLP
jgi:prolyl-tRNA editing enzyme YbaK/EbsC (Cys-tRNA(Pro) deacylase)